ncbi:MAG: Ig-like domain-containing protein, partial [Lysobacterales bacterium]
MKNLALPLLLAPVLLLTGSCAVNAPDDDRRARQFPPGKPLDSGRKSHRNRAVSSRLTVGTPIVEVTESKNVSQRTLAEPPKNKTLRKTPKYRKLDHWSDQKSTRTQKGISSNVFDAIDFEDNANNSGGFAFIPADPSLAAGPNHLVAVTNTSIAIYDKSGNEVDSESLQDFFSSLSPPTFTFDPKVLFDQFENRFVVLTLEREDIAEGDSRNTSRILLAVSDSDNPTGAWSVTEIDGFEEIGGEDHWVDFPGLAVDEDAIYITANMFRFFDQTDGGAFGGARVWIVDKGVSNGFYDGDPADVDRFNPFTSGSTAAGTHQPAHVLGTPPSGNTGTWMVLASGLGTGSNLQAQVVRIDNPLANSPTFNFDFVSLGNIDQNRFVELDNLPQSGSALDPDAGDRRALDAVWRDNSLYFTSAVRGRTGPDTGENTAIWAQINTQQSNNLVQLGLLGGEDIGGSTETAFGAISVNNDGVIALGFTSANSSSFLSSHYALHLPGDASGSNRGSELIRDGQDPFELTFGGSEVRWGDYSSVALDPNGTCFWVYNKHAIDQGSPTSGEIGRWGTAAAEICSNQAPTPVADALTVAEGDNVTRTDEGDNTLLDNDSDPDGDLLDINRTPTTQPGVGTVSITGSGSFNYIHDGSDSSNDLFRYEVCDNGEPELCAEAQVNVVI